MKNVVSFFSILCVLCMVSSSVFAADDIWKQIEDSYYSAPYTVSNDNIDSYMVTQRYALEFGLDSDEYDQNMQQLQGVSITSRLRDMGEQYAMVSGEDGFEVGIIKSNGNCDQTFGSVPGIYQINLSDSLKAQLQSSGLNLQNTVACHVIVNMHSSGVLFSDGSLEFYAPITARFESIDLSHLYSKEELLSDIISHKEDMLGELFNPDDYNTDDIDPEEGYNPNTGAC